jgi:hypothetical protein
MMIIFDKMLDLSLHPSQLLSCISVSMSLFPFVISTSCLCLPVFLGIPMTRDSHRAAGSSCSHLFLFIICCGDNVNTSLLFLALLVNVAKISFV